MPTPSDGLHDLQTPLGTESLLRRSANTTCPPDDSRVIAQGAQAPDDSQDRLFDPEEMVPQQTPTPPADAEPMRMCEQDGSHNGDDRTRKERLLAVDLPSPPASASDAKDVDAHVDMSDVQAQSQPSSVSAGISPIHFDLPHARLLPNYTYFLHPGSKFRGTQQSEKQIYDVQVELKHVDMKQSFLCGYLRIQGLTEDHPHLTTYFEGEIVGDKYTFQTKHPEWGSNDRVDKHHWERFPAFRPFAKQVKKCDYAIKNFVQRENLFMRWKEYFLIPDHVRTISGASFEGFYYICFNQVFGTVSGIYFHARSEKHQQLELKHVPDRGCYGAMEFR